MAGDTTDLDTMAGDTTHPATIGDRVGMFITTAPTGIVAGGIVATGITVDTENAVGTLSCCDGSIECRDRRGHTNSGPIKDQDAAYGTARERGVGGILPEADVENHPLLNVSSQDAPSLFASADF
jgi:hypothetical protein